MALEKDDLDRLDERYVKKDDCTDIQSKVDKKFANDDKRIELFEQKIKSWDKLFWAIASASIAQFVALMFNLIKG